MTLRFSIVIPNYNSGPVLERAIRSVLDQDYPDLQLILVDSESTDESRDVIERYRERFDVLIREKDRGQADGLNKGFRHADGDIFGWLCADDELAPGALRHVTTLFSENPEADVVLGACQRHFPDGATCITPAADDAWQKIGIQNVIDQPGIFWRSTLHRRLGELDASYHLAFDWDLWCRMRDAGARLIATDRVLARYYFTETNKSGSAGRMHMEESFRILRRYGPFKGGLAYIYRFLYHCFDLKGCYDRPPTCTKARALAFVLALGTLRGLIGRRLLYMYNWHFASCQQRNLKWW